MFSLLRIMVNLISVGDSDGFQPHPQDGTAQWLPPTFFTKYSGKAAPHLSMVLQRCPLSFQTSSPKKSEILSNKFSKDIPDPSKQGLLVGSSKRHVFISIFSLPKTQNVGFQIVLMSNIPTRLKDKEISKCWSLRED